MTTFETAVFAIADAAIEPDRALTKTELVAWDDQYRIESEKRNRGKIALQVRVNVLRQRLDDQSQGEGKTSVFSL